MKNIWKRVNKDIVPYRAVSLPSIKEMRAAFKQFAAKHSDTTGVAVPFMRRKKS